jgi:hypothetical protein
VRDAILVTIRKSRFFVAALVSRLSSSGRAATRPIPAAHVVSALSEKRSFRLAADTAPRNGQLAVRHRAALSKTIRVFDW